MRKVRSIKKRKEGVKMKYEKKGGRRIGKVKGEEWKKGKTE
jgi:hypothetical protein